MATMKFNDFNDFISKCARNAGIIEESPDNIVKCRILGKDTSIFTYKNELGQGIHLIRCGYWEPSESFIAMNLIQPDNVVVDIGACYGYYTVLAASIIGKSGSGKVISVEPNPKVYSLLEKTVAPYRNVYLCNKAIWNTTGEIVSFFQNDSRNIGSSRVFDGCDLKVETITLDDLVKDFPRVDFVKMDVEAYEDRVWAGATDTFKRHRPIIMMELTPSGYEYYGNAEGFISKIYSDGYVIFRIYSSGFFLIWNPMKEEMDKIDNTNLLLIPKERINAQV